ncbi:hypothetical protein N2152v2_003751 [Parachlorella kessleri]
MSSKASKSPKKPVGKKKAAAEKDEAPPAPNAAVLLSLERLRQQDLQLDEQSRHCQDLLEENARLEQLQLADAKESYEATAFFRQELAAKTQELAELQAQVDQLQEKLVEAARVAAMRGEKERAAHEAEQAALRGQLSMLQHQVDSVAMFQGRREEMEAEVKRLQETCQHLQLQHDETVTDLQQRLLQGVRMGDDGPVIVGQEAVGDVWQVLKKNKELAAQMKACTQEAEELNRDMKALEAQKARLLRDVKLRDEMEHQYALRGTLQAREIKDAASKISSLEKGMAVMALAFEQEKQQLVRELRTQLAEALTEQTTLRRLLKLRTKELNHVRGLAHEVLLQRTDVESFLLSSIQHVRTEVVARQADAGAEASKLQLEDAVAASSKADIRELSWEDRERILRQLFVKINNQRKRPVAPQPAAPSPPPQEQLQGRPTAAGPAGLA